MSRLQSQITHHTKNYENFNLNEKRQSIDANIKMAQMLGLCISIFYLADLL